MIRCVWLVAFGCSAALAGLSRAEKAPLSLDELRKTATHIVTGRVGTVFERTEVAGDWKYTRFVAEVRVDGCEKGDGIRKGELVYVRYYRRAWVRAGEQLPSSPGHTGLPAAGDAVRVYLARNAYDGFTTDNTDGGFNVIGGNGFAKLTAAVEK
jgi:hypothetical protein